jgi:hypothetical protein
MVTLDRIRLTGLLRKSLAHAGLFYAPATRLAVALPSRQPLGGLSEPLGPSARPAPSGCAGNVPNRTGTVQPGRTLSSAVPSVVPFADTANRSAQRTSAVVLAFAMSANIPLRENELVDAAVTWLRERIPSAWSVEATNQEATTGVRGRPDGTIVINGQSVYATLAVEAKRSLGIITLATDYVNRLTLTLGDAE